MPKQLRPFFAYEVDERLFSVPNPRYPIEHFEAFIVRLIVQKKRRIERELDLLRFGGPLRKTR